MRRTDSILLGENMVLDESGTDEYVKSMLDYFAKQVDNQTHTALVSEIMERYVDISKQLEEKGRELEKSELSLREAQEIALIGNWELNLTTKQLWWSDTINRILEIEASKKPDLMLYLKKIHPDDKKLANQILRDMENGMVPAEYRYRLLMEGNRIKWVHIRFVASKDSDGKTTSVHGTIQDITNGKAVEEKLEEYNHHLEVLVQKKVEEVSASQMATIHALVKLSESRDDDTGEHIVRTSKYCRLLAEKLRERNAHPGEINRAFIDSITQASPLHDIGKVGIPDAILLKPGKLTAEEFEVMKTHTTIGYQTLASVEKKDTGSAFIKIGKEITLCHHEKWDGSGYPKGLKGEEIPISARIMALADVYDALRSKRVYKEGYSHEKSSQIMTQGRGSHFDPLLVDLFLENAHAFCNIFERSSIYRE
ncbi:HD-GYP domain-containing protein [Lacrimispora saccharolytica]|nr:HD domain-containing phosphohydrolase [Lacrimispora saccharolytica]QRV20739.1 HD domain-containing protein [Lacrimispora saccharolytica]